MRLNVAGTMPLSFPKMAFVTPLGPCELSWDGGSMELAPFETALIPACQNTVRIKGRLPALCSTLPDRESLRAGLGYRAEDVAGLTE